MHSRCRWAMTGCRMGEKIQMKPIRQARMQESRSDSLGLLGNAPLMPMGDGWMPDGRNETNRQQARRRDGRCQMRRRF
ncbi:Uncharacterized protein TCM_002468 [Theobroma cacao]|uniref:Uncharacterized protein n=1 Tax=Theobroma cacao TaxID=3641 RepID=A0A061DND9_THECC|nr:Uncharacterized protein TCM_002468 [Theobroma cacao]